jgi:hypothetical protein
VCRLTRHAPPASCCSSAPAKHRQLCGLLLQFLQAPRPQSWQHSLTSSVLGPTALWLTLAVLLGTCWLFDDLAALSLRGLRAGFTMARTWCNSGLRCRTPGEHCCDNLPACWRLLPHSGELLASPCQLCMHFKRVSRPCEGDMPQLRALSRLCGQPTCGANMCGSACSAPYALYDAGALRIPGAACASAHASAAALALSTADADRAGSAAHAPGAASPSRTTLVHSCSKPSSVHPCLVSPEHGGYRGAGCRNCSTRPN